MGFLDTPVLNKKSDKPAPNNTLLDKPESSTRTESSKKAKSETPKKAKKLESKPSKETKKIKSEPSKKSFVCHLCGARGHIRPFCYKMLNQFKGNNHVHKGQSKLRKPNHINRMPSLKRNVSKENDTSKDQVSYLLK